MHTSMLVEKGEFRSDGPGCQAGRAIKKPAGGGAVSSRNLPAKPAGHPSSLNLPGSVITLGNCRCRSGRGLTVCRSFIEISRPISPSRLTSWSRDRRESGWLGLQTSRACARSIQFTSHCTTVICCNLARIRGPGKATSSIPLLFDLSYAPTTQSRLPSYGKCSPTSKSRMYHLVQVSFECLW